MGKKIFTKEIEKFICDNVNGMYLDELTVLVNNTFNTNYTKLQIKNFKNRSKLCSGVSRKRKTGSTLFASEIQDFIFKNIKGKRNTELTKLVNEKFGTNYTTGQIKNFKNRRKLSSGLNGSFEKGHIPHNKGKKGVCGKGCEKGWFKKGHKLNKEMPIGSERQKRHG